MGHLLQLLWNKNTITEKKDTDFMENNTNKQNNEVSATSAPKGVQTTLTPKEIKAIRVFADSIKNSGMNPWGNLKRGRDMKLGRPKKVIFNKEDVNEEPKEEKFKNK